MSLLQPQSIPWREPRTELDDARAHRVASADRSPFALGVREEPTCSSTSNIIKLADAANAHPLRFQVILPTYNASRWFEEALASVAGHPDGEVLVIDDGSADDERQKIESICARYKGVRFFARPREGIVAALNFGLSIATAPYIARMDADDISLPGRFDRQLAFLDSHPDIALIGGKTTGIDSEGKPNGKKTKFPTTPDEIAARLSRAKNPFMHPSVMMRRDAILSVGGYRPATEYAEDYDLWLRLVERYRLANFAEPLVLYRRHERQITRSINWQQKFARDIATFSYLRRRENIIDPIIQFNNKILIGEYYLHGDSDFCKLQELYKFMDRNVPYKELSIGGLAWIERSMDHGLFGSSSKAHVRLLAQILKNELNQKNILIAINILFKGLKKNPNQFLKFLITD
jgi:glycosyltransferase involved in cell wall biosynthesis